MGNAKIWYTPIGSSTTVEIDLGRPLSQLVDYDVRDESVAQSFSGTRRRVVFTATRYVDVSADLLDDYEVVRQLEGLCSHLRRNGLCTLSEDGTTFAAILDTYPVPTSKILRWATNLYEDFGSVYTPAAGDVLTVCGPSPRMLWAEGIVASGTTTSATLEVEPVDDWQWEPWVLARYKGFWPVLRLRSDAPPRLIEPGNRITFNLALPLEVPPGAFDAIAQEPGTPIVPDEAGSLDNRVNEVGDWVRPGTSGKVVVGGTWRGW